MTMLFVTFSLMLFTNTPASRDMPGDTQQPEPSATVLITGSNRGIGFEFARQYAQKGWVVLARLSAKNSNYGPERLGYNSRLDAMQAALLRVKLKHIDTWNKNRNDKAQLYSQLLRDSQVRTPGTHENVYAVFWFGNSARPGSQAI